MSLSRCAFALLLAGLGSGCIAGEPPPPPAEPPIAARVTQIAMPATLRVWRRGIDGSTDSCQGRVDLLPLEEYVRGVLPREWFASWEPEALKAGALAVRTYAWYWISMGGKYPCADVDDTVASQVYREERAAPTDAAVEATAGQIIVRNGAVVFSEYSAENGDPTAEGIMEPHCSGQGRNGHGRGMCQWGTQRWAQRERRDAQFLIAHYYRGAMVQVAVPGMPMEPMPRPSAMGNGLCGTMPGRAPAPSALLLALLLGNVLASWRFKPPLGRDPAAPASLRCDRRRR